VVDWVKAVRVHLFTRGTIKIKNLDGDARRLYEHIHQSTHSYVLDLAYGRFDMGAAVALQRLVDERLELVRVLLNPCTGKQLG
jgi:hypothetical protein